jgi:hypothetical protein
MRYEQWLHYAAYVERRCPEIVRHYGKKGRRVRVNAPLLSSAGHLYWDHEDGVVLVSGRREDKPELLPTGFQAILLWEERVAGCTPYREGYRFSEELDLEILFTS